MYTCLPTASILTSSEVLVVHLQPKAHPPERIDEEIASNASYMVPRQRVYKMSRELFPSLDEDLEDEESGDS